MLFGKNNLRYDYRMLKDKIADFIIASCGLFIIFICLLIIGYLLWQVIPLLRNPAIDHRYVYQLPSEVAADNIHVSLGPQGETAFFLGKNGVGVFFNAANGKLISKYKFNLSKDEQIRYVASDLLDNSLFGLATDQGNLFILKIIYNPDVIDNEVVIVPQLTFPYGTKPVSVFTQQAITSLALKNSEEELFIAALNTHNKVKNIVLAKNSSFLDETISLDLVFSQSYNPSFKVNNLLIGSLEKLYLVGDNNVLVYFKGAKKEQEFSVLSSITSSQLLAGGESLLLGSNLGEISQWFSTGEFGQDKLTSIRSFSCGNSPIKKIIPEKLYRGFLALNHADEVCFFNVTAESNYLNVSLDNPTKITNIALSPRTDSMLAIIGNKVSFNEIQADHSDVSWNSLWRKIWYESYEQKEYIWQSSAANDDFEPKFSLIPLIFGTLKGAFYALLLASPLAICAAIYTAYFMHPRMRRKVKPVIEIMEALPTVVLGFIAGLFLAPLLEEYLTMIFILAILLPISVLLAALLLTKLPYHIQTRFAGWHVAFLIPVVVLVCWLSFYFARPFEIAFFNGHVVLWLRDTLGVSFDQRNALIVGIAMGFAIIPTIFSMAEDAIFHVPKHIINGSLALGATLWQTVVKVVIPAALPGIFSALMLGIGRAVGETMIVLMATGNTPIMEMNIFEGMRTLAANIAVEMPESAVGSTHFRILFLTAVVLFIMTFIINTFAEIIRQKMRNKYGAA